MSQEFWRDPMTEQMINDIIDIFHLEGVELVRLSGLLKREQQILSDLNSEILNNIIVKLKANGVINYRFTTHCPHCREISYQIAEVDLTKIKICDTCNTFYNLISGTTLEE
jgi:sugar/nucleoside kinase (ribokinase family)